MTIDPTLTEDAPAPKRAGRRQRMAKRAAKPAVSPCAPGQKGGQYRPLDEPDIQAIYATALRLLSEWEWVRCLPGCMRP
jgi:trimethylamine--corrinoid protein Co-methyltransferase